jgi:hypothetical protein
MDTRGKPSVRPLYAWEIHEARRVFGSSLRYERVRIHENVTWPNTINRIGTRLKGMPYTEVQNAITLSNHCYFPVKLLEAPRTRQPSRALQDWLVDPRMTHAWQYQHLGWSYLRRLSGPTAKAQAYDFGEAVPALPERWLVPGGFQPGTAEDITRSTTSWSGRRYWRMETVYRRDPGCLNEAFGFGTCGIVRLAVCL